MQRLARMDRREVLWRVREKSHDWFDRGRVWLAPPRWDRGRLEQTLAALPDLQPVRSALSNKQWQAAHQAFSDHLVGAQQRFVLAPALRTDLAARIRAVFPGSVADSTAAADRIVDGRYDLLGYNALSFGSPRELPDWNLDPINRQRAPRLFWKAIPFLDPQCGDHKLIWELNRHQHWLSLGRAFWLTGDPRYRTRAIDELMAWMAANPPLIGINWASMLELAFRSLSWVWALNLFAQRDDDSESPWTIDLLIGLDRQLDHIERHLSYYFSPNTHLLGEALALYATARALPVFAASSRRESLGRTILIAEIDRQIADDGGHCERSMHYHRYALDFYLLALALAQITRDDAAIEPFAGAVDRLASAARLLADDRGRLPHFGDEDGGFTFPLIRGAVDDVSGSLSAASILLRRPDVAVGPPPEDVYWLLAHDSFADDLQRAQTLRAVHSIKSSALKSTGYFVSRSGAGMHLVFDSGPHGYQNAGHAHADALSLTLTIKDVPFLIDPGTGWYTINPALRDRLRSSTLHNTLTLDGQSQSIPAGPFHWRTRADAAVQRWWTAADTDYFEAVHDGYLPVEHRRYVFVHHDDLLIVADRVSGDDDQHTATVHWHVNPQWRARLSGRRVLFHLHDHPTQNVQMVVAHGSFDLFTADDRSGLGWYSPVYGRVEAATTLRHTMQARPPFWIVTVVGLSTANQVLEVTCEVMRSQRTIAVCIERESSVDRLTLGEGEPDGVKYWTEHAGLKGSRYNAGAEGPRYGPRLREAAG
jgi:uncharacterized heparinase superfamily protein